MVWHPVWSHLMDHPFYFMMKFTTIALMGLCCFCFFVASAQPIAGNGCMTKTNPNRVYQTQISTSGGLPVYQGYNTQYSEWTVQYDITQYPCFTWTQTAANGCYIKFSESSSTLTQGNYGNFTGYAGNACLLPIDDYIPLFCVFMAIACYFYLKQATAPSDKVRPRPGKPAS